VSIEIGKSADFYVALRILLTLPVTVASGKRSFQNLNW